MTKENTVLTNPTYQKLVALNLLGMARAFGEQRETASYGALAFEDRLGLLVDREATERDNRRLERNLKAAKLRLSSATIEDLDFRSPRGLERSVVLALASADWVAAHQNVLVTGPTGAGKTFIACALAHAALRAGRTALYLRAARMLDELAVARADGRLPRVLAAWARIDVLVLDDLGLQPLATAQAADLLEVIEDRAGRRPTIVTSQLPIAQWHASLGEATVADAICDRLLHHAHRIELRGESLRRSQEPATASVPGAAEATEASTDVGTTKGGRHPEKRAATKPEDGR